MLLGLLGCRGRLGPDAGIEVELVPAGGQDLAAPLAGQHQESDDIRRLLVLMLRQRRHQSRQFAGLEVSLALGLVVALDAAARVVHAHFFLMANVNILDATATTRFAR